MHPPSRTVPVLLLALACSAHALEARQQFRAEPMDPGDPTAQRVTELVEILLSGEEATAEAFLSKHAVPAFREGREALRQARAVMEELGTMDGLSLAMVFRSPRMGTVAALQSPAGGGSVLLSVELEPEAPHRIAGFELRSPDAAPREGFTPGPGPDPSTARTKRASPPSDLEPITLDLRVHLVHSPDSEALSTTLTEEELVRVFEGVNEVWSQAGIRWRPVSISRPEPPDGELYERVLAGEVPRRPGMMAEMIPADQASEGWDVFFIRDLGGMAGGVYLPPLGAVVQAELDPSGARDLEGELVRILSHELGHALSLPHVGCPQEGNLMAPGCPTGERTYLTAEQIEQARRQAESGRPHPGSDRSDRGEPQDREIIVSGEHYEIHGRPGLDVAELREDLDLAVERWKRYFGQAPPRLALVVFESAAEVSGHDFSPLSERGLVTLPWVGASPSSMTGLAALHGPRVLSHEACHAFFGGYVREARTGSPARTGGPPSGPVQFNYGAPGVPHWFDEAVATLCEDPELQASRHRWLTENRDRWIPLDELLVMEHPVMRFLVDQEELEPGQTGVGALRIPVDADVGSRFLAFYAQALSFAEFLAERNGPTYLRDLADGFIEANDDRHVPYGKDELAPLRDEWREELERDVAPSSGLSEDRHLEVLAGVWAVPEPPARLGGAARLVGGQHLFHQPGDGWALGADDEVDLCPHRVDESEAVVSAQARR